MQIFSLYTVLGNWRPYYYVNIGKSNSLNSPDISWQNNFNEVNAFKRSRLFGTEEAGRWFSIRRIAMDLKLSKSTVEYMLKTNSERKKEERSEKINWQEN